MPWRSAKTRRPAAGASSRQTPRTMRPRGENFSCIDTSSGSSLALAGLHAAQRLRRTSFPRREAVSKGWPEARSEKVRDGGR